MELWYPILLVPTMLVVLSCLRGCRTADQPTTSGQERTLRSLKGSLAYPRRMHPHKPLQVSYIHASGDSGRSQAAAKDAADKWV